MEAVTPIPRQAVRLESASHFLRRHFATRTEASTEKDGNEVLPARKHRVIEIYFVLATSGLCTSCKSRPYDCRSQCSRPVPGELLRGRAGCKRACRLHSTHAGQVCHS